MFSPDGKLLYATENDFDNAAGMIGIYDATDDFRRVGEFPTHGVGPHELLLMPDGRTLAIANGGIETHPDFGRAKLNIATMKPSLVFIDRVTRQPRRRTCAAAGAAPAVDPSYGHRRGRRASGSAASTKGPASEQPQLVGRAKPGSDLKLLDMPEDVLGGLRNYVGSVAANRRPERSRSRRRKATAWPLSTSATGAVRSSLSLKEVCGLAPDRSAFMATTGTGEIVDPRGDAIDMQDYVWDNHLLRIA